MGKSSRSRLARRHYARCGTLALVPAISKEWSGSTRFDAFFCGEPAGKRDSSGGRPLGFRGKLKAGGAMRKTRTSAGKRARGAKGRAKRSARRRPTASHARAIEATLADLA